MTRDEVIEAYEGVRTDMKYEVDEKQLSQVESFFERPVSRLRVQDVIGLRWELCISTTLLRDCIIKKYGFVVPCREMIDMLLAMCPLVEVGAGTGAIGSIVKKEGGDIILTDSGTGHFGWEYTDIQRMTARESVEQYSDRNVFVSWPDYSNSWGAEMLKAVAVDRLVAYIGEGHGGCTGDDEFHEILERDFELSHDIDTPQWPGLHDRMQVYRRVT